MDKNPEIELRFSRAADSVFIRELSIVQSAIWGDGNLSLKWHISGNSIT